MSAFRPNVGILPGHTAEPAYQDLLAYATLLDQHGATAVVPELPVELTDNMPASFWTELDGFPRCQAHMRGQDMVIGALAEAGVHALLVVNTATQDEGYQWDEPHLRGALHHSVSDRIGSLVGLSRVPVALTHKPKREGGDTQYHDLARRQTAIHGMEASVVGEDLAGMSAFLAEHASPGVQVHPYRQ